MIAPALTFPAIDPVLIEFGPLAIRWYALAYIAGLVLGWLYMRRLVSNQHLWAGSSPASRLHIDDLLLWVTLGVVLGGRFGYVAFYDPAYFLAHPADIPAVWRGGMSFHGGFLGVVIAIILYGYRHRISILSLLDLAAAGVTIGLFFGRIANFINGELFGRITDAPWAMVFPGGGPQPRHPSQLYEAALEGLVLFAVLRYMTHKKASLHTPGMTAGIFALGYGIVRSFVELFRMPDAHIGYLAGGLTMGIVLSIPMALVGLGLIWHALRSRQSPAG